MNFDDASGCQPSELCDSRQQLSCEASGGRWEPGSCGDYQCGQPPACTAVIAGCNCGPARNFEDSGCATDPACGEEAELSLCESTGGVWESGSCGHYTCGQPPDCDAIIPGCNCGPDGNFTGFGEVDSGCN
jgi:hypothetical protein